MIENIRKKVSLHRKKIILLAAIVAAVFFAFWYVRNHGIPFVQRVVPAAMSFAPQVPPPLKRWYPAVVRAHLHATVKEMPVEGEKTYEFWTFNESVPGPFIRVREGDTLEVLISCTDKSGRPHNVDLHAVTGMGGGASLTTVVDGETRAARFKMLHPGLFVYHCAAPPVMDHIANGMYGLILVEPKGGLRQADREFYVMQSEIYARPSRKDPERLLFSHEDGLIEHPRYVVFNGRYGSLLGTGTLHANQDDRVRIFFGNAGPNKISSFHVIGEIFDRVYREGDLVSPPARSVQTTLVPAGGAAVVEFDVEVPGTFTLVDHAIFRLEKGTVGFLEVLGKPRPEIYQALSDVRPCEGCGVHP